MEQFIFPTENFASTFKRLIEQDFNIVLNQNYNILELEEADYNIKQAVSLIYVSMLSGYNIACDEIMINMRKYVKVLV